MYNSSGMDTTLGCEGASVECVVPENIHTPLPTEGKGNSEGMGGLTGGNFRGSEGLLTEVFCQGV